MNDVDLSGHTGVTTELLLRPLEWRVRAVEAIALESAERCTRRRSLQCAPLRPLLAGVADIGEAKTALLVLNVATVPRGPLLDFDVEGPDADVAFLLPRGEVAQREAEYLLALAEQSSIQVEQSTRDMLVAVLGFATNGWFVDGEPPLEVLTDYLSDGLGFLVPSDEVQRWHVISDECGELLMPYLQVNGFNVAVAPVFALPGLLPADAESARKALVGYRDLLTAAIARDKGDSPARDLLGSLADYGYAYDLLVAVRVPLDEPFMLKYAESRELHLDWWTRTGTQDVVIADAVTNHVSVRVTDPNVRLADMTALTPDDAKQEAFGQFTVMPSTSVRSFYAHGDDREFRARLHIRLTPLRRLELVNYAAPLLVMAVIAVMLIERPQGRDLALLFGPTALSATVLLNREPTTLGSRLRLLSTALLAGALLVMAAVALVLYAF